MNTQTIIPRDSSASFDPSRDYQAAKEVNILPCQMQSTTWFAWKRINNILYSSMLSLFSKENDLLGIEVDLDCIKPF